MIFNIVSYKGSLRLPYIEKLLTQYKIKYNTYEGDLSTFGWDAHKDTCMKVIEENYESPYIIIAEDDLEFTESFSINKLKIVIESEKSNIICTGIFCEEGIRKEKDTIFVDKFRGTQLIVIFKEVYDRILSKKYEDKFFETILSELDISKSVTVPFLSSQNNEFTSRISQHRLIKKYIAEAEKRIKYEL